ncbi:hypothetical protein [Nevskia sp.]|uniref:hypothetical protein n=1 Tax=Nevskia sp. TaxID=1929292 RepID=UPI0025EC66EE|nr:hypothetical protein [Nevskia sp.]
MKQACAEVGGGTEVMIGGIRAIFPAGQSREDIDSLRSTLLHGARTLLNDIGIGRVSDPVDMESLQSAIFMLDIARGLPED